MKSYKIHLVRHGLTAANEQGLYIGRTDLPLSPAGLADLLAKKQEAEYPTAKYFYTAPLTRCRQTMEVLYPGCQPEIVEPLTECDFGEWDGKSVEQLKQDDAFAAWLSGAQTTIPGGEDTAAFQARIMAGFEAVVEDVMKKGDGDAVICTHGGVIMLIMAAYALPQADVSQWGSEPGCGFTLRVSPSLWMREPVAEAIDYVPLIPQK